MKSKSMYLGLALATVLTLGVGCSKDEINKLIANFGDDTPEVLEKRQADLERVNRGEASQLKINLVHTVVIATALKNNLVAALPNADLDNHCIQWKEYVDADGAAHQVELHATACPQPAAPLSDATKVTALNITEVDRDQFGNGHDELSRDDKVLAELYFNDARTEEQGKSILNSICQVGNGITDTHEDNCELKETGGKLTIERK